MLYSILFYLAMWLFQNKHSAIPEKSRQWGLRIYSFEETPGIFRFVTSPWKFQIKQSFTPGNPTKLFHTHCKFEDEKPRLLEISH